MLDRDASQWEAFATLGIIHYQNGALANSLADFDRAIELKSGEPDLYQNRATILVDLGRFDEAARDLDMALGLASTEDEQRELPIRLERLRSIA